MEGRLSKNLAAFAVDLRRRTTLMDTLYELSPIHAVVRGVYVGPTCSSVAPSRGLLRTLKPNVSPKGLQTPRSNCLENTHVCTTSKIFTLTFDSLPGVPTCEMHDVLDPRSAWWVLTSLSFRGQTYFSPCQTDLKLLMCSATQSTALLHCASVPTGV